MKFFKIYLPITISLFLVQLPAHANENKGNYIAVPNGSGLGIWVVDTNTGKVKLCFAGGSEGQYTAKCSNWTK